MNIFQFYNKYTIKVLFSGQNMRKFVFLLLISFLMTHKQIKQYRKTTLFVAAFSLKFFFILMFRAICENRGFPVFKCI